MALLSVENLRTYFHTRDGLIRAVDGVSFSVDAGKTLGIVGESGSGKSVTGYSLLGLVPCPPGEIHTGTALFDGVDLLRCSPRERRAIRGKRITTVFQDPMTALNPYMTIGAQVMEPLQVHERCSRRQAEPRAVAALESVGIQDPEERFRAYPHQFSGGMRQRATIAMALITQPQLLIADEPTTALDVTVQAQILALIAKLQEATGMAVVLITHDLGVIAGMCDHVLVMYAGRILESAEAGELFHNPQHPYTKALMASLPSARRKGEELYTIPGLPPDPVKETEGCPFAPRCEHVVDACRVVRCSLEEVAPGHQSACIRVQAREV